MLNVDLITVMYTSTLAKNKKKQTNKETKTKARNNKTKQNNKQIN